MALQPQRQPTVPTTEMGADDRRTICKSDWVTKDAKDKLGDLVDRVLVATDRFVIYSVLPDAEAAVAGEGSAGGIAKGSGSEHVWLRTLYPDDYETAKQLRKNVAVIGADLAYICDVVDSICRSGELDSSSSASLRRRATEMMARAMEMAYEANEVGAKEMLGHLRTNATALRDSKNRMRYVQGNLAALGSILALWLVLRFAGVVPSWVLLSAEGVAVHAYDVLALGALGAYFAVSASVSSIQIAHSVSLWEMFYTGSTRILIGVIAAGVAVLLLLGEWLLASIQPAALPWTYLLLGFIAGFSELFVPNALRQVEAASTVAQPRPSGRPQA